MTKRNSTQYIVVHCSATKPKMDIGAKEIRQWHLDKGWSDIGYAAVIRRDGTLEQGRDKDSVGAHVAGYNSISVGICLVGGIDEAGHSEDNFTQKQFDTLEKVIREYKKIWPKALVRGHRDFPNVSKDCPCFDVQKWWRSL